MTDVTLGIDIGGTNTVFGIVTEKGEIIFKESIPTNGMKPAEDLFERIFDRFDEVFLHKSSDYQLVGIGVANVITNIIGERYPTRTLSASKYFILMNSVLIT